MKLVRYEAARSAVAECRRVDEVKDIRDKAQAMAAYARQAKDTELLAWVTEIKVRAERKAGQMLAEMKVNGARHDRTDNLKTGPKSPDVTSGATLDSLGISKNQAARWQKLADVPEDKFEQAVAAAKEVAGEVTTAAMLRLDAGGVRTQTTGDDEWYTPAVYIERSRKVMGSIDIDPASNAFAQNTVQASNYFDSKDDGLRHEWRGNVWLNPPYSRGLMDKFVGKLREELKIKRAKQAVLLTHNFTDTAWFRAAWEGASAVCFTYGRIKFYNERGQGDAPTSGHVFLYFGEHHKKFLAEFRAVGNSTSIT